MERSELIAAELVWLRQELQSLKNCQLAYFTASATATGLVLGLAERVVSPQPLAYALLAPLAVILPCWLIFFDKATTITRNIGYARLLETWSLAVSTRARRAVPFRGFETALGLYRKRERWLRAGLKESRRMFPRPWRWKWLSARHQYWFVNHMTFLVLSTACIASACAARGLAAKGDWPVWVACIIAAVVTARATYLVIQLMRHAGKYSYATSAVLWRRAFR